MHVKSLFFSCLVGDTVNGCDGQTDGVGVTYTTFCIASCGKSAIEFKTHCDTCILYYNVHSSSGFCLYTYCTYLILLL